MESGPGQFGGGIADGIRELFYRIVTGIAILVLVVLFLLLIVPLALIGLLFFVVRAALGGVMGTRGVAEPGRQPIPDADGEGRENVRVRRE